MICGKQIIVTGANHRPRWSNLGGTATVSGLLLDENLSIYSPSSLVPTAVSRQAYIFKRIEVYPPGLAFPFFSPLGNADSWSLPREGENLKLNRPTHPFRIKPKIILEIKNLGKITRHNYSSPLVYPENFPFKRNFHFHFRALTFTKIY